MSAEPRIVSRLSAVVFDWLLGVEAEAVAMLDGRNDRGDTRQSVRIIAPSARGAVIEAGIEATAKHALFVHQGRRPGRRPPRAALLGWVERKLGLAGKEAEQVAYLVARKIGRTGTRGTPFLRDPVVRGVSRLSVRLSAEAARAVAESFPSRTL